MGIFKNYYLAASSLLLAFSATQVAAGPVGVLALLESKPLNLERSVGEHGCIVRRQGAVLARQGNMELPEAGSFALLSCEEGFLQHPENVSGVFGGVLPAVMLEGALTDFEIPAGMSAPQDRQYLIKLSYYNNADLAGRSSDLEELQTLIQPLADPYRNEGFLEVHRASGMRTPDEAVVLYYDSPAAGDRFRENNQAVLEKVGAFNKQHLVSFVYLIAKAE
jgi:hypothetical protein